MSEMQINQGDFISNCRRAPLISGAFLHFHRNEEEKKEKGEREDVIFCPDYFRQISRSHKMKTSLHVRFSAEHCTVRPLTDSTKINRPEHNIRMY